MQRSRSAPSAFRHLKYDQAVRDVVDEGVVEIRRQPIIAEAVEKAFKVTVRRVNVMNYRGKNKKSRKGQPSIGPDYKKAIVTLKVGDKIELV